MSQAVIPVIRKTSLVEHVIQFCAWLRNNGFKISSEHITEVLYICEIHIPRSFEKWHHLLKGVLIHSYEEYSLFDDLYIKYWKQIFKAENSKIKHKEKVSNNQPQKPPSIQALKSWLYNGRVTEETSMATYSKIDSYVLKDFSTFTNVEIAEMIQILKRLSKHLATRYRRRFKHSNRKKIIDLRKTLAQNFTRSDDIDYIKFKTKKKKKLRLTLICDVSKSMELYNQFILTVMYGFHKIIANVETFVFGTKLTHLGNVWNKISLNESLSVMSKMPLSWSGGTDIGGSLMTFKKDFGKKYVNRNTVVIIISDGWDTGEADELEDGLQYLKRNCKKLIWINPLSGNPLYQPETLGMQVAMPYIDYFGAAHNMKTLFKLTKEIFK